MSIEQYNVEPTASVIDDMANELESRARELRDHAQSLRKTGDFTYAAEVLQTAGRVHANLRMDLLLSRPLRAIEKHHAIKADSQPGD